jgi:RNA polymerase sigma factor (sigma-70 family)
MTRSEREFEQLVSTAAPRILAYVARRSPEPADAADIVAEVLLIAWRRFDRMPADEAGRIRWLYGVARRVLANHRRGRSRHDALAAKLRFQLEQWSPPPPEGGTLHVRAALARLPAKDQELLRLIAWEQLTPAEAAEVLGVSSARARKRLQRARERLRRELATGDSVGLEAVADLRC